MGHFSHWPSSTPAAARVPAVHVSCVGRLQLHRLARGKGHPGDAGALQRQVTQRATEVVKAARGEYSKDRLQCTRRGRQGGERAAEQVRHLCCRTSIVIRGLRRCPGVGVGSRSERGQGDGTGAPIAGLARPGIADQMVREKDG